MRESRNSRGSAPKDRRRDLKDMSEAAPKSQGKTVPDGSPARMEAGTLLHPLSFNQFTSLCPSVFLSFPRKSLRLVAERKKAGFGFFLERQIIVS